MWHLVGGPYPCFCSSPAAKSEMAWDCQGFDGRGLSRVLSCLLQVQCMNRNTNYVSTDMQGLSWPYIRIGSSILRSFISQSRCWQAKSLWEEQFSAGSTKWEKKFSDGIISFSNCTNPRSLLDSMGSRRPCNWVVFWMCCVDPLPAPLRSLSVQGSICLRRSWWLWRHLWSFVLLSLRCRRMDMTHAPFQNSSGCSCPRHVE